MNINEELLDFLWKNPTCFQVVDAFRNMLKENGYEELKESGSWKLTGGGKYFTVRNESSLIAFRIPECDPAGFMITASHTDSPAFKVKANPEIVSDGYVRLNIEGYGGMLMHPWYDRPLTLAGRIIVRNGSRLETRRINIDRDLLMIPSLAIHMNRMVNKGQEINVQNDMLPILGEEKDKGCFLKLLAKEAGIREEDILAHDLFLVPRSKGTIWGADREFLSAPHLDDLQCSYASIHGFLSANSGRAIPVSAVFDNEEVGSLSKQGADSTFLKDTLERIVSALGYGNEQLHRLIAASFLVSADNAHAVHPDFAAKADPVNRPHMNKGIVIKYSANQKYCTDAVSSSLFKEVCRKAKVPFQEFTNRSDMVGGSTLGNISNSHVSLNAVDIGLPQLAMHSPYETAGTKDTEYLIRALSVFFSLSLQDEGEGNWTLS